MTILHCEIHSTAGIPTGYINEFSMLDNWQDQIRDWINSSNFSGMILKIYKSESKNNTISKKTTKLVNGKHMFVPDRVIKIP